MVVVEVRLTEAPVVEPVAPLRARQTQHSMPPREAVEQLTGVLVEIT